MGIRLTLLSNDLENNALYWDSMKMGFLARKCLVCTWEQHKGGDKKESPKCDASVQKGKEETEAFFPFLHPEPGC